MSATLSTDRVEEGVRVEVPGQATLFDLRRFGLHFDPFDLGDEGVGDLAGLGYLAELRRALAWGHEAEGL